MCEIHNRLYYKLFFILFKVFVGKIPKDVFEDELIPLFEKCGKIWDLRLMMDPMTGSNRGYCFVTFCEREGANEAVKQVSNNMAHNSDVTINLILVIVPMRKTNTSMTT